MAAGNKVVLTFAGESSGLERSFDQVGSSAKKMGTDVNDQAGKIDRLGEAGGNTETRFLGLGAGISGVGTLLSGDLNAETAAMAMADLGDAVEHTVAPLLSQGKALIASGVSAVTSAAQHVAAAATTAAAWVTMGIQATINAAKMAVAWLISLGPIGLVIAAVGAVIGILVALGVGFDDIANVAQAAWDLILGAAQAVWNWLANNWPLVLAILTGPIGLAVLAITSHWETIKAGFTAVKDWIVNTVSSIVTTFTGLPGRISAAVVGLWDGIKNGFKGALNAIIGLWNNFEISFGGYDIPGPGPNIPSFTIKTPNIPLLHTGGTFHAPAGQREGLAMLLDGERVSRPGASAGMIRLVIDSGSNPADRVLVELLRKAIRVEHGGDVQAALGFSR